MSISIKRTEWAGYGSYIMTPQPVPIYQNPILWQYSSVYGDHWRGAMTSYRWLFAPLIPHARNEDQSRRNRRLEDTQQHSYRDQRPEALAYAIKSHADTPEDNVGTQVLGRGKTLHQVTGRQLEGKVRDVEHQSQSGVLVGIHVRVLEETHDCSVVDWTSPRSISVTATRNGAMAGRCGGRKSAYSGFCPETAGSNTEKATARSSSRSCAPASSHQPLTSTSYLHDWGNRGQRRRQPAPPSSPRRQCSLSPLWQMGESNQWLCLDITNSTQTMGAMYDVQSALHLWVARQRQEYTRRRHKRWVDLYTRLQRWPQQAWALALALHGRSRYSQDNYSSFRLLSGAEKY